MINNATHLASINSPVRTIKAEVRIYDGGKTDSVLLSTYTQSDCLKSFTIERVGGEGFFGFGVCQKLNVKLLDVNREKEFTTSQYIRIFFGEGSSAQRVAPWGGFRIHECRRDELTNELSITAYDAIYDLRNITIKDIDFSKEFSEGSFQLSHLANYIAKNYLNCSGGIQFTNFKSGELAEKMRFTNGSVLTGDETLREVLDWIAQTMCAIYYLDSSLYLRFKRLDRDGDAKLTIDKSKYIELSSKTNRRLKKVGIVTALGNNMEASIEAAGTVQYIRNNPFFEAGDTTVAEVLNNSTEPILGMTINQFDCSWRGNYLTEIGDKIGLVTKDNETVFAYILNDTITYNGALSQKTEWKYEEPEGEASNPSTIGEMLNQTFATVDKVNKEINLVVSTVNGINGDMSELYLKQNEIAASVKSTKDDLDALEQSVKATITAEDVKIEIETALSKVNSKEITTTTGYTFDADGLKISKSGSEMTTEITEDGMTVYRGAQAVLVADNEGVKAEDLHATTYLLIGTNSRLEDYGSGRTGCFWIGK